MAEIIDGRAVAAPDGGAGCSGFEHGAQGHGARLGSEIGPRLNPVFLISLKGRPGL